MAAIKPSICSCIICKKLTSQLGIKTHYDRIHGNKTAWENSIKSATNSLNERSKVYNVTPNFCVNCKRALPYDERNKKFCNHKCSAVNSNLRRKENGWVLSSESKLKIGKSITITNILKGIKPQDKLKGDFCRIFNLSCKFCKSKFFSRNKSIVCLKCKHLKYNSNKDEFSFKFNIYNYPELFDLNKLKNIGWVSFGGKRGGIKNLNGLSRDHKVSIDEAKRNKYDPYYISHPLNCDLMPMKDNNKKKTKSSIKYEDLIILIDEYDAKRGVN